MSRTCYFLRILRNWKNNQDEVNGCRALKTPPDHSMQNYLAPEGNQGQPFKDSSLVTGCSLFRCSCPGEPDEVSKEEARTGRERTKARHRITQKTRTMTDVYLLTQFFPRTAPPDGQTELTVLGWEFQSPLRPAITSRTHQVQLGQTACIVIPAKSNNTQ